MGNFTRSLSLRLLFIAAFSPLFLINPAFAQTSGAPRPMVVLFPMGQDTASGIAGDRDEAANAAERTQQAARALRDRLSDTKALLVLLYSPDSPVFALAAQQAKLDVKRRRDLTVEEQIAIGKEAGAICVVAVSTPKVLGGEGDYEILVRGQEIADKKEWKDQVRFAVAVPPSGGDANAVAKPRVSGKMASDSLMSAANTLSVRILSGPLGAYGRPASPGSLPAPLPKPVVEDAPPVTEANQSGAALQQARDQVGAGDTDGAIITLRKAINRSPLELKLRLALTKTYQTANRENDAAQEARRALSLASADDREDRIELSRILADTLRKSGDSTAARALYEQALAAQPRAVWARVGLGDLLMTTGQPDAAEKEYRAALQAEPGNRDALLGVTRVFASRGDYDSALKELTAGGKAGSPLNRPGAIVAIFDQAAPEIASLMQTNREAWEGKRLSREAFYNATKAEEQRANSLLSLLRSAPPAESAADGARKSHSRRVLAGSLLCQSAASLLSYLDSGDADAGAQAALYLDDFQKEFAAAK